MRAPKTLTGEALEFWKRNAPLCERMGTLTSADRDSFLILCSAWSRLQECISSSAPTHDYVCLAKQYKQLADAFGLTPAARKKLKIEPQQQEAENEYGL